VWRFDIDSSHDNQRSVSGYQLLGGTTVPPHPSATRMLGFEPWQKPVRIDAVNASTHLDVNLTGNWRARVAVGHSRSAIDDNVAYAYGCFYATACAGSSEGRFFGPNGEYDIYDYRSPGDTRRNDEARASLEGSVDTGPLSHEVSMGVDAFRRRVDQRRYVYDYVGTANIDQIDPPYFAPSPNQPGPSARRLTSWQRAVFAQDRIGLADHWQLLAGARLVRLDERAYNDAGVLQRNTRLTRTLPQAALLWLPSDAMTGYLSYSRGLSLGGEAPWWTSNGGAILGPRVATQLEAGAKYVWHDALSLNAALFRIRRPNQFAMPDASAAGFTFIQRGEQVHTGVELSASGRLGRGLRLTASARWLRARVEGSGVPGYDGHQALNVPRLRASVFADYRLPFAPRVSVLGGWRYSASKTARADGSVSVPAYNVFDAGLKVRAELAGHATTWRLNVDNLFNRFYWRDSGSAFGDTFLFPGAPRLARLSVTVDL
jgi:iron complex outermembrane recepter protein